MKQLGPQKQSESPPAPVLRVTELVSMGAAFVWGSGGGGGGDVGVGGLSGAAARMGEGDRPPFDFAAASPTPDPVC
jgi:hypothetical protein